LAGEGTAAQAETVLRSRRYIGLLIVAGLLGVPISALSYGFLQLTHSAQTWTYTDLPHGLGLATVPIWWPVVPLALAGLMVGATVRYMPGAGGEVPVDGFHAGGPAAPPWNLLGIALAAGSSIALGAVVGPEGPLIALGAGAAVLAVRLARRNLPKQAAMVIAATGSFAAVSTLLGSPIVGAFLLMEVVGLAGATASVALVPGLLGAGVGALIFTGLGSLTGQGTFSLAIPNLPAAARPTFAELGYALLVGLVAPLLCWLIRHGALALRPAVERWVLLLTFGIAMTIAGLAIAYDAATNHPNSDVLFSGQDELPALIEHASGYSVGAALLLVVCKGLAYSGSLVGFRGGPTFPAMFIGAAGGIALSHLPGLPLIPAVAIGIGAMAVGMLRLPFTSVLLTSLFLGHDGVTVMPLVIIAIVVSHIVTIRLTPVPDDSAH
jgi:H+/Cl- antiporter ClcA